MDVNHGPAWLWLTSLKNRASDPGPPPVVRS